MTAAQSIEDQDQEAIDRTIEARCLVIVIRPEEMREDYHGEDDDDEDDDPTSRCNEPPLTDDEVKSMMEFLRNRMIKTYTYELGDWER